MFELSLELKFRFGVVDAASGNEKYIGVERSQLAGVCSTDYSFCFNHQTMLGQLDMIVTVFMSEFLKTMHSVTSFLNYSCHRLRMMLSLRPFLAKKIKLLRGTPLAIDSAYAAECRGFLGANAAISAGLRRKKKNKAGRAGKQRVAATPGAKKKASVDGFFTEIHGGFDLKAEFYLVYVGDVEPTHEMHAAVVDRVYNYICDGMLTSQAPTPSSAKWTKTSPASSALFFMQQGRLMDGMMRSGLCQLTFTDVLVVDEVELDESHAYWKAVAGKSYNAAKKYARDDDQLAKLPLFLIADEPNIYLQLRHLHHAHAPLGYNETLPTIMQIYTNDKRSHVYRAMVGVSAVLMGTTSRMIMAWRFRGCSSMFEWFRDYPADALLLYRASSGLQATIQTRQRDRLQSLEILSIGDPDMRDAERIDIIKRFAKAGRAKLGDGICADLWEAAWVEVGTGGDIQGREDRFVAVMTGKARLLSEATAFVSFSVAPLRKHTRQEQAGGLTG